MWERSFIFFFFFLLYNTSLNTDFPGLPSLKELPDDYNNVLSVWKFNRQTLDSVRHHAGD